MVPEGKENLQRSFCAQRRPRLQQRRSGGVAAKSSKEMFAATFGVDSACNNFWRCSVSPTISLGVTSANDARGEINTARSIEWNRNNSTKHAAEETRNPLWQKNPLRPTTALVRRARCRAPPAAGRGGLRASPNLCTWSPRAWIAGIADDSDLVATAGNCRREWRRCSA